jgi:LPXTG-motif cell wall-anchored protein
MKRLTYIVLVLISLNSYSQEFKSPILNGSFLFTHKDKSYLISGDSIYNNSNETLWIAKKHDLIINDFAFVSDGNKGYLMHNSGGVIYQFDGVNFKRIDESFEFNTQYQSFPFLYNGAIYNFGGYGLFTFKNILTYFNESKKETEYIITSTSISKSPFGRKKMFGQLVGNDLFIGSGYGYDNNKENGTKKAEVLDDYWKFNLKSKEWNLLGFGKQFTDDDNYTIIYGFNGKNLLISKDKVYAVDIKENEVDFYDNANIDFIKSLKQDVSRAYITYNKSKDGFYMLFNKPNLGNKLLFISTNEFLGKPTRTETLYSIDDNSMLYYLFGGLLLVLLFLILVKRKKNSFQKICLKRTEIDLILNEEEKQIFNLMFDKHPEFIQFPDLMDVFESHLSYESKKKKLRSTLYQIEDKIMRVLKSKNKIFIERRNKEDLRIKEIKIQ